MTEMKYDVQFIDKEVDLKAFCKIVASRIASGDIILEQKVNEMINEVEKHSNK